MSHWSKTAKATIAQVVAENPGKSDDELLELIDAAYPFGQREHWPYKVWLTERCAFRLSRIAPGSPLADICGACGADIGKPCREYIGEPMPTLDYFHEVRGRRVNKASGPLFGEP